VPPNLSFTAPIFIIDSAGNEFSNALRVFERGKNQ